MAVMTVTELLSMINRLRNKLKEINEKDSNASYRIPYISILKSATGLTPEGLTEEQFRSKVEYGYNLRKNTIDTLQKLLIIKEEVNHGMTLTINFDGTEKEMSVASVLMLKSKPIKEYYMNEIRLRDEDIYRYRKMTKEYMERIDNKDAIDRYVLARMDKETESISNSYSKYYTEYMDANKITVLDPMDVIREHEERKNHILDFYNDIDMKLLELNASTKIFVDLKSDELWSFI